MLEAYSSGLLLWSHIERRGRRRAWVSQYCETKIPEMWGNVDFHPFDAELEARSKLGSERRVQRWWIWKRCSYTVHWKARSLKIWMHRDLWTESWFAQACYQDNHDCMESTFNPSVQVVNVAHCRHIYLKQYTNIHKATGFGKVSPECWPIGKIWCDNNNEGNNRKLRWASCGLEQMQIDHILDPWTCQTFGQNWSVSKRQTKERGERFNLWLSLMQGHTK